MKQLPQLTHLLLSYYRENPEERKTLQPITLCKVSRRWGTFNITCPTLETYIALLHVQHLLREPIARLRLAKKVRIAIQHHSESETFAITPPKGLSWEESFKNAKLYR
ncbi:MAG: hypothetical protein MH252_05185 [Thermosynechococcaceae cyanobacterium MS004]|nr:hypothetical protein [Thermosynechococcaceae cyanobacterium MS004]